MDYDLIVLFEHPEWQKPLFAALDRRGVRYWTFDLKQWSLRSGSSAGCAAVLQSG